MSATTRHVPILVEPIVSALIEAAERSSHGGWLVDATLGGGGHAQALLERLDERGLAGRVRLLACDQDPEALERAGVRLQAWIERGQCELVRSRMSELADRVGDRVVVGLLADLGFSSDQIEAGERGLSFQLDGPLDMRMDPSRSQTAWDLLNTASEVELARILYEYGEERFSRRIAARAVLDRASGRLPSRTHEFAQWVGRCYPAAARHGRRGGGKAGRGLHPATRTFQALRIAVNDELVELDTLLGRAILKVIPGGRVAILSFHSLEDRRVKETFSRGSRHWRALTRKPVVATDEEVVANPRSRSARLRIAERMDSIEGS